MVCPGVVTNVTNFGAFVDVGVHQDGLVHVSELSDKFVKDPREAVKVGDVVKVRVLAADPVAKRISLSMKPPPPPKVERPPRPVVTPPVVTAPPRAAAANRDRKGADSQRSSKPPQAKPMTLEEKLALLGNKFRTRV